MITKFLIDHFRGFDELELAGLQPVNLIVGKNNAGKTSLLEALALLSNPQVMMQQLPTLFRPSAGDIQRRFYPWLISDGFAGPARIEGKWDDGVTQVLMTRQHDSTIPGKGGHVHVLNSAGLNAYVSKATRPHTCKSVPIRHVEPADLVRTFSQAVRQKDGEKIMEWLLKTVDPRVEKIRVDAADDGNHVMIDMGLSQMLPLAQAGQGMYRLVSMLAGLIGDRPNLALVDEMDDGIHHSVLPDVWTGIAEVAEAFGIQVFVTTHSYECIQAAHEAFSKREKYGMSIVQLFRLKDRVEGRVMQKDQIEAALEGGIDLRN